MCVQGVASAQNQKQSPFGELQCRATRRGAACELLKNKCFLLFLTQMTHKPRIKRLHLELQAMAHSLAIGPEPKTDWYFQKWQNRVFTSYSANITRKHGFSMSQWQPRIPLSLIDEY